MKLIFYMQANIKLSYNLRLLILVDMARPDYPKYQIYKIFEMSQERSEG